MWAVSIVALSAPETRKFRRRLLSPGFPARKTRPCPGEERKTLTASGLFGNHAAADGALRAVVPYYKQLSPAVPGHAGRWARARAEGPFSATGRDSDITVAQEICSERRSKSMCATAGRFPSEYDAAPRPSRALGATRLPRCLALPMTSRWAVLDGNVGARSWARLGALRGDLRAARAFGGSWKRRRRICSREARPATGTRP